MNDFLEIGYWRQRYPRVQRVLDLAERLTTAAPADAVELERQLSLAVREVRAFDAVEWPFPRVQPARTEPGELHRARISSASSGSGSRQ